MTRTLETLKLLFVLSVVFHKTVKGGSCQSEGITGSISTPAAASDFKYQNSSDPFPIPTTGRLPTWIYPIHYKLNLSVYLDNTTYNGSISIDIKVQNQTDKIVLNAVDLVLINETCKVLSSDGKEIPIKNQTYDPYLQFFMIHLNGPLAVNDSYVVQVSFRGTLNSKLVGFYLSTYKDAEGNEVHVASTQFSPTDARRAFPCFDEPGFKATFDINIERDGSVKALSNMPIVSTSQAQSDKNRFIDSFEKTLKMSTYLVGFLISDFSYKSSEALNDTQFRVWCRHEALDQIDYSLEVAPKILLFLEDYFGTEYPLPKLDMAAIPNFKFRGMENWGLIMFRESAVLYDPAVTTVESKRDLMSVVAHELAHMWFGNLVTPQWWSELWLKEGFANFMGFMAIDNVEPAWKMMDDMVAGSMKAALSLDSLVSSHPINVEVSHPDRISEIFDAISYNKGASIIRMMYHFLSDEVYKNGMRNYIKGLQYRNAVQGDLWHYLTEAWKESKFFSAERTVERIMNTWTLQEGFPLVSVQRNGSHVTITQERFLLQEQTNYNESLSCPEQGNKKWWVPINLVSQSNPNFTNTQPIIWLKPEEEKTTLEGVPDENQWFIINSQKTGFYRVNYDNNTWHLLLQQLLSNHSSIHHLNREQILDDAFVLARAGYVYYSLPLQMAQYMKKETNLIAWTTFLSNYRYLYDMAKTTERLLPLKKYVQDLIVPLYNVTGFVDSSNDSYDTQSLRILANTWACKIDYVPCLKNARKLFKLWLELPQNESSLIITNNIKPIVLCNGIKSASYEEWNKTFEVYLNSNVQTDKKEILTALGCTEQPQILSRFLEMALNSSSGIIKQDTSIVFQGTSQSRIGATLAWESVKRNWTFLIDYLGSGSSLLWSIFQSPTKYFNSKEDIVELEEFIAKEKNNLGSARQTVEQTLERVKINKHWMDNYFVTVSMWIKQNVV